METKMVIETRVEALKKLSWFGFWDDETDEWVDVSDSSETIKDAAEKLGLTEKAVEAISMSFANMVEFLVDELSADLADIWKKVD